MTLSFSFELPPAVRGSVSAAFTHTPAPRRIIVAISDASCAVYGARLLQVLQGTPGIETHLIASEAGWHSIEHELDLDRDFIEDMADEVHDMYDIGSSLGSSTFACSGMVIAPCSAGTLAAVAHGLADNLVTRVADLMLQERRRLVLLTRESPLHLTHLRNMVSVTEMGGIICPAVPAFCLHPQTVGDIVNHGVGRVLDLLDVPHTLTPRGGNDDTELAEAA